MTTPSELSAMAPLMALALLIALSSLASAQPRDRLLPGSVLSNDEHLTSSNGTVQLGFFSVSGAPQTQRYLGIWFSDTSAEFIALWIANRDQPVTSAASLHFTDQGQLQIQERGNTIIWSTPDSIQAADQLMLLNTANLILTDINQTTVMWQSFDHPADVWVPNMKMNINMNLTSWSSKVSPSSGRYVMRLRLTKEYLLSHVNHLESSYWSSGAWDGRIFAGVPQMRYNYLYNFTFNDTPPAYFNWFEYTFNHSIFRLEHDGVIRVKYITSDNRWTVVWPVPTSACTATDLCGNGICTTGQLLPCSCPVNSVPVNQTEWQNENWSQGCLISNSTISGGESKSSSTTAIVVGACAGAAAALVLLVVGVILVRRRNAKRKASFSKTSGSVYFVDGELSTFTYKQLQGATDGFSKKLGSGGFGEVFKGSIQGEAVAVKRLMRVDDKQFRAEVSTIGTVQHINLVRLRGFCVDGSMPRMLVYEFVENGSLDRSLFVNVDERVLDWSTRFAIALGTAKGIAYLHEECRDRIIHCDIKPENILLDAEMRPKVGDFGLAKLLGRDFSRVVTSMRGTRGYLAPEWLSNLPITPKADVFSYGMTVLEIISGRRNIDVFGGKVFFPLLAAQQAAVGGFSELPDERLGGVWDAEQVERAVKTAIWCVQDNEAHRPSMKAVVQMLDGNIEFIPPPPVPSSFEVWLETE